MEIKSIFAIVGLCMAAADIYLPKLSMALEGYLDSLQEKLYPFHLVELMKDVISDGGSAAIDWLLENISVVLVYMSLCLIFMLPVHVFDKIGLKELNLISLTNILISKDTVIIVVCILGISLIATLLMASPYIVLHALYLSFTIMIFLIILILKSIIHSLNILGRGKALAGVGLLLAVFGVLE